MEKLNELFAKLPNVISAIVRGETTREQLDSIVALSHSYAIVFLKKKLSSGKLNLSLVNLDIHDIAYDCIAELFRMDGEFPLIQLKSYFLGIDIERSTPQQLADHVRRLTFSKVNHGLFRLYSEYDSSLSKILRNIKLAVQTLNNFVEVERFGETYLVPAAVQEDFSQKIAEPEIVTQWLHTIVTGNERIPEILSKVSLCLQRQNEFAKAVSFIGLGISLRNIFSEEFSEENTLATQQEELDTVEDAEKAIERSCRVVKQKMFKKYVSKNKISEAVYQTIFHAIQQQLIAIVVEKDGHDSSLYERMKNEISVLSKKEYKKQYKAILEYLFSLTKEELGRELIRKR